MHYFKMFWSLYLSLIVSIGFDKLCKFLYHHLLFAFTAIGGGFGTSGLGLIPHSPGPGRMRACIESVLAYDLVKVLTPKMKQEGLLEAYKQVKLPLFIYPSNFCVNVNSRV